MISIHLDTLMIMECIQNTTTPGVNKDTNLHFLNEEESNIVGLFSRKYWYVTRVDRISIAGSNYNTVLIKPTNQISMAFNLYREVVVVFSNYKSFEPRSLDAVDGLNIQELRLEEICCIIISKDDEVSKKISTYLKSNQGLLFLLPILNSLVQMMMSLFPTDSVSCSIGETFLIFRMH